MEALFHGEITPWEDCATLTDVRKKMNKKIEDQKKYFKEKLSEKDCERFERLEDLYFNTAQYKELRIYSYGFTLGAMGCSMYPNS